MLKFNVVNLLNNLEDLNINEGSVSDEYPRVIFTGKYEGKAIEVELSFSLAPSLQSLLSRRTYVGVSLHIKVDGVSAQYASDLDAETKNEIGDWMAKIDREIRSQREKLAFGHIEKLIEPSMTKK